MSTHALGKRKRVAEADAEGADGVCAICLEPFTGDRLSRSKSWERAREHLRQWTPRPADDSRGSFCKRPEHGLHITCFVKHVRHLADAALTPRDLACHESSGLDSAEPLTCALCRANLPDRHDLVRTADYHDWGTDRVIVWLKSIGVRSPKDLDHFWHDRIEGWHLDHLRRPCMGYLARISAPSESKIVRRLCSAQMGVPRAERHDLAELEHNAALAAVLAATPQAIGPDATSMSAQHFKQRFRLWLYGHRQRLFGDVLQFNITWANFWGEYASYCATVGLKPTEDLLLHDGPEPWWVSRCAGLRSIGLSQGKPGWVVINDLLVFGDGRSGSVI